MRGAVLIPIVVCWGAALAALYVHPAFWIAFAALLILFVARAIRGWTANHD